jgi:hypothetical protein
MEDNEMNSLVQRAVGVFREHGALAVPEAARFALLVAEDVNAHSEYAAVAEDLSDVITRAATPEALWYDEGAGIRVGETGRALGWACDLAGDFGVALLRALGDDATADRFRAAFDSGVPQ